MDPGMIFVLVLIVVILSFKTFRPVAHALADVLRSRLEAGPRPDVRDEQLEALRDVVDSLSDEVARLTERVDFTERLLQKPHEEEQEHPKETDVEEASSTNRGA